MIFIFRTRKFLFFMVLTISLLIPLPVSGESELSLQACVRQAIRYNKTILSFSSERRAVAMEVKQALAPFYPSLSFATSFNRTDIENSPRSDSADLNLKASYSLFKGGKDWSTLTSKKHAYRASNYNLQEESLKVVATVQKTYYAILSLRNRLDVLARSVEAASLHERLAKKRVKAGLAPLSDHLRAMVDLSNARVDLIQAQRKVKTLRHALAILMGLSPIEPVRIKKETMTIKAGKENLKNLFELAKKNRPVLKSYKQQILELKWREKSTKAEFSPTLDTYLTTGQEGHYYMPDKDYWEFGVVLSYPIFSGFSTRYAVASARARLEAKRWSYQEKVLQVQREIADAYDQIKTDEKVVKARKVLLKSALENLKVAERRYEVGVGSIVELTDARVAATDAAIGLENAKLTVWGDEVELKRVTGWFVPMIQAIRSKRNVAKEKP